MRHAFFIAGERVVHIANASGAGFQYRAQAHILPPQVQAGPFQHELAETVLFVSEGTIEVMINGATAYVTAGSHFRVPARTTFGYRNVGDDPAHVLCRTAPAAPARDGITITVQSTAA